MNKQLIIRLNTKAQLFVTIFASVGLLIMFIFFTILDIVSEHDTSLNQLLILWSIFLAVITSPFLVYLFLYKFHKHYLYIDEEKIIKRSKNKIHFEITWDEIKSIKYIKLTWWHIANLFIFSMQLHIEKKYITKRNPKFADKFLDISMSYKDALKIRELFYPKMQIALKKNKDTAEKPLNENLNKSNDLEQFKINTDVFETNDTIENQNDNIETTIQKENIENDNNR